VNAPTQRRTSGWMSGMTSVSQLDPIACGISALAYPRATLARPAS
jgi:hypothetical protein